MRERERERKKERERKREKERGRGGEGERGRERRERETDRKCVMVLSVECFIQTLEPEAQALDPWLDYPALLRTQSAPQSNRDEYS